MTEGLERLNAMTFDEARAALLACCGSTRWSRELAEARPFAGERELEETADSVFGRLGREDWLEAFRSHPKIGGRRAERETGAAASGWSKEEQSGVGESPAATLEKLARLNHVYEEKFGYIFIVCATGKSAAEMLALLEARLGNAPDAELPVAAEEQRRITHLRLKKLLSAGA